jgi:YVTN family beta-propeller protein
MPIIVRFIFFLMVTFLVSGCGSPKKMTVHKEPLGERGELYLYLQPLPQEMQSLSFTISNISVIPEVGDASRPILPSKVIISGEESTGMQKRLTAAPLPAGRYKGISLAIEQAGIVKENGGKELTPPAEPLLLEFNFSIPRGAALALFIDLSSEFLVTGGDRFTPRFVLGKSSMPPRNYLGFISNSKENIVTVFNKNLMEVIQVIRTGAGPKGMALDQLNGIVYVAAAGDDLIEVINIATLEIIGTIRLEFGDNPTELALTPDGRTLLSANYGSSTVSIIDTHSLSEDERLVLDPDPVWIVIGPDGATAYVLHTMSNTVSIIDVAGRSLLTSISLDESPVRAALGGDGDSLYIISEYSTDLLVVDPRSLQVIRRIFIGSDAASLETDPKSNYVYIGKKSGEIVVVDPTTEMFIDSFAIGNGTDFITIEGEENVLLILTADGNMVHKFNLVGKRKLADMETEEGGHALVVMGKP